MSASQSSILMSDRVKCHTRAQVRKKVSGGLSRQEEDVEKTFSSWSAFLCIAFSEVRAHMSTERTHEL